MKKPYWKKMGLTNVTSRFRSLCKTFAPALVQINLIIIIPSYSQTADSLSEINSRRLKTVVVASAVTYTGTMVGLNAIWYSKYDRQSFHFFDDSRQWKQMDKSGHLYSAFQLSFVSSRTLQWSGVSKKKSDWAGSITSFAVMSSIEMLDGFSAGYGASASDLLANAAGAGFYLGQQVLWKETRIYPKLSFHRTHYAPQRPETLGADVIEEIVKDYNGQTYWLSVDVDRFVRFPKWLNLAVGYGAEGMLYANDESNLAENIRPYRKLFLSIDFDLTSIKSRNRAVNMLIYVINMIKLPAPALELSQGNVKGYFFYF